MYGHPPTVYEHDHCQRSTTRNTAHFFDADSICCGGQRFWGRNRRVSEVKEWLDSDKGGPEVDREVQSAQRRFISGSLRLRVGVSKEQHLN